MRVYQVTGDAVPSEPGCEHYAPLAPASKRDENFLRWDDFMGKPFSRKWHAIRLYVTMPMLPRPDFYDWPGAFICTRRARELAAEPLEMCGELLPVSVEREKGRFYMYNVTNCINALDHSEAAWKHAGGGKRQLVKPAFVAERLGELSIFKIPEDFGLNVYCLERSGDPDEGEFKAVVEHHGLTGLRFELVWTDGKSRLTSSRPKKRVVASQRGGRKK